MVDYKTGRTTVPKRRAAGRPKGDNPFVSEVSDLIDAVDEDGAQIAGYVVFDGPADKRQNDALRIACRRMDEAGRELGYTVRKSIEDRGDGTAMVVYWPTEKIKRGPAKAAQTSVAPATVPAPTPGEQSPVTVDDGYDFARV